jgi:hypothetical protein
MQSTGHTSMQESSFMQLPAMMYVTPHSVHNPEIRPQFRKFIGVARSIATRKQTSHAGRNRLSWLPLADTMGQPDGSWTRAAGGIDRAADRRLLIHASSSHGHRPTALLHDEKRGEARGRLPFVKAIVCSGRGAGEAGRQDQRFA